MESHPCYNPEACCGKDCYALYNEDEPCWGDVYVEDEEWTEDDYYWVHACEGHLGTYPTGKYTPKPS